MKPIDPTKTATFDIHQQVTGAIVAVIEAGPKRWKMRCPRSSALVTFELPRNVTDREYRGIMVRCRGSLN